MARFVGAVGYAQTVETSPGVWQEVVEERQYVGEFIKRSARYQPTNQLNDDVTISTEISIIPDLYFTSNMSYIRYVKMFDAAWKVTNISPQAPRVILTIGGVYNGPTKEDET